MGNCHNTKTNKSTESKCTAQKITQQPKSRTFDSLHHQNKTKLDSTYHESQQTNDNTNQNNLFSFDISEAQMQVMNHEKNEKNRRISYILSVQQHKYHGNAQQQQNEENLFFKNQFSDIDENYIEDFDAEDEVVCWKMMKYNAIENSKQFYIYVNCQYRTIPIQVSQDQTVENLIHQISKSISIMNAMQQKQNLMERQQNSKYFTQSEQDDESSQQSTKKTLSFAQYLSKQHKTINIKYEDIQMSDLQKTLEEYGIFDTVVLDVQCQKDQFTNNNNNLQYPHFS